MFQHIYEIGKNIFAMIGLCAVVGSIVLFIMFQLFTPTIVESKDEYPEFEEDSDSENQIFINP